MQFYLDYLHADNDVNSEHNYKKWNVMAVGSRHSYGWSPDMNTAKKLLHETRKRYGGEIVQPPPLSYKEINSNGLKLDDFRRGRTDDEILGL